jgi:hypothetical protein
MESDNVVAAFEYMSWPPHAEDGDQIVFSTRPFATSGADLDIAFEDTPRPTLVTQVLTACVRDADAATVVHWNVNRRLQALQAVAAASGARRFSVALPCAAPTCDETLELELDLVDFDCAGSAETFVCQPDVAHQLSVRLPTGADQIEWLNGAATDVDALQRDMATRLVLDINGEPAAPDWRVPAEWIDALAAALEQYDRSTALELHTRCPSCAQDMTLTLDLEARLLTQLHQQQRALLDQIHRLADAYHWTERDILALTPPRRRYYLTRIAEERAQ